MCVWNGPGSVAAPGPRGVRVRLGRLSGELTELPRVQGHMKRNGRTSAGRVRWCLITPRARRIVHHGRLLEFTGQSRRAGEALMFGRNTTGQPGK